MENQDRRLVVPLCSFYHSVNQQWRKSQDIDPLTGDYRLMKIPGILTPGVCIEVPAHLAEEMFGRNRDNMPHVVREPDTSERLNWERAGRLSIC